MILRKVDVNRQRKGTMQTNFNLSRTFPILLCLFSLWQLLRVFWCLSWTMWGARIPLSVVLNVLQCVLALSLPSHGVFLISWSNVKIIRFFKIYKSPNYRPLNNFFNFVLVFFSCFSRRWGATMPHGCFLSTLPKAVVTQTRASDTGGAVVTNSASWASILSFARWEYSYYMVV